MNFQESQFANIKLCWLLHIRHSLEAFLFFQQNKAALNECCSPLRPYKSDVVRHLDTHENS